jgi:Bacterial Ig-like domain (group 3)
VPIQIKVDGLGVLIVADAQVTTDHDGTPIGTVQFKDGNTNIGDPVPVTDGHAFLVAFRPQGSHLTAVFIPRPGSPFLPSTSNTVMIKS